MNSNVLSQIVHILAVLVGVLSIIAGASNQLGLPSYVVAALGIAIVVLTYVANQLPALGGSTNQAVSAQPTGAPPSPASKGY